MSGTDTQEWLWQSEELPKFFNQSIVGPLTTHSHLYTDDSILPTQRLVMVFGRPGVGKRTALEAMCKEANLSYTTVDGRNFFEGEAKVELNQEQLGVQVMIIEQANDMVAGAYATQQTREFMLDLRRLVDEAKIFIICLMDVVPKNLEMADRDIMAVQINRNFDATVYFGAPPRPQRELIFKRLFDKLFTHLGPHLANALEDGDYTFLADSSAYATPLQMQKYVQRVATLAIQKKGTKVDQEMLKRCLYPTMNGTFTISTSDNGRLEDQFAVAAGFALPSFSAAEEHEREQAEQDQLVLDHISHFVAGEEEEEGEGGEDMTFKRPLDLSLDPEVVEPPMKKNK